MCFVGSEFVRILTTKNQNRTEPSTAMDTCWEGSLHLPLKLLRPKKSSLSSRNSPIESGSSPVDNAKGIRAIGAVFREICKGGENAVLMGLCGHRKSTQRVPVEVSLTSEFVP